MTPFLNMSVNGAPSPADLAKAALAKTAVPSDGQGEHQHDHFPRHDHGEPSLTDAQVAYLEQRGYHVDRHHNVVLDHKGGEVPPSVVGAMLRQAQEEGLLGLASGEHGNGDVAKCVSELGETAPVVRFLDLRG
jgi:hypothetical protein